MRELPDGLDGRPQPPGEFYVVLREITEGQISLLDDMLKKQSTGQRSRPMQMRSFWAVTMDNSLNQEFTGMESPVAGNLRDLELVAESGAHE